MKSMGQVSSVIENFTSITIWSHSAGKWSKAVVEAALSVFTRAWHLSGDIKDYREGERCNAHTNFGFQQAMRPQTSRKNPAHVHNETETSRTLRNCLAH